MSVNNNLGLIGLPIGSLAPYMGKRSGIPTNFLPCDGRALDPADYPDLYEAIGQQYGFVAGEFYLPILNDPTNYLEPCLDKELDKATDGLLPPIIKCDAPITLVASDIPSMSASGFAYATKTPDMTQNTMRPMAAWNGTYSHKVTDVIPYSSPQLLTIPNVTYPSSNCVCVTAPATGFVPNAALNDPQPVEIIVNEDHPVQYGGITCIWIIKAYDYLIPYASLIQEDKNSRAAAAALIVTQAAYEAALANSITQENIRLDAIAANELLALNQYGQGGGTEVPYANVNSLSGFVIPANPTF